MIKRFYFLILLFSLHSPLFISARTVRSLDEVPNTIQYSEGKNHYSSQMSGVEQKKHYNNLPKGLSEINFINWLAPDKNSSNLIFTGIKPWGKNQTYIGVACFAKDEKEKLNLTNVSQQCSPYTDEELFIGVFQWKDQQFTPIAKSKDKIDLKISWNHSQLDYPVELDLLDEENRQFSPYRYDKLDLAPYKLSNTITAFGLRSSFFESYSGGGAYFEALHLFIIKDGDILNIFSEPVYFFKDIAGNWNDDSTRQHDITEGKNIVLVLNSKTDGFHDLQIKSLDSNWKKTFIWSKKDEKYNPKK